MCPVVGVTGKRMTEGHLTSPTPTTKKMKLKPDINMLKRTLPTSPIGKKTFITNVKLLEVNEDNIWIIELEKPDGAAGFMKPLSDLIKTKPAIALDMFHVISLMKRKNDENVNEDVPKMQSEGSMWPRLVFVCFKDSEESPDKFGNWMANQLTNFSNQTDSGYLGSQNLYVYQKSVIEPKPVYHYLLTKDCINLIKKIYGTGGITKEDVMNDDMILTNFFGSVEKGRSKLDMLTETQWQYYSL
jgi:hypothetical protein